MEFAGRVNQRLFEEIERGVRDKLSAAEICRRVRRRANELGVQPPCYERVRVLVNEVRARPWEPGALEVAVDVAFRARPPDAMLDVLAGTPLPRVRR